MYIIVQPAASEGGEIFASLNGQEWLRFQAILDESVEMRLLDKDHRFRGFPPNGVVQIRRGFDYNQEGERIVDEFRYEEGYEDDETGETVPECFKVTLFMDELAFDRLVQRLRWGPPEVRLGFALSSEVISYASPAPGDYRLRFKADPRQGERVESATLVQRPSR